jgi:hypothetical protein
MWCDVRQIRFPGIAIDNQPDGMRTEALTPVHVIFPHAAKDGAFGDVRSMKPSINGQFHIEGHGNRPQAVLLGQ